MDMITIIGVLGSGSILVAFFFNQSGRWSKDSITYDAVNAFGSAVLILYAFLIASWPFLILNTVWFVVSAKDLVFRK